MVQSLNRWRERPDARRRHCARSRWDTHAGAARASAELPAAIRLSVGARSKPPSRWGQPPPAKPAGRHARARMR